MKHADQLLAENDKLRDEVRALREVLAPPLPGIEILDLTPSQQVVFRVLYLRAWVSYEALSALLEKPVGDYDEKNALKVRMCKMRKRLAKHDIEIENVHGHGYRMTRPVKALIKLLLEKA